MSLTAERAREMLDYDPATGVFTWRVAPSRFIKPGTRAGHKRARGEYVIRVDDHQMLAARLAWLMMTGALPAHEIDHADCDPSNDTWANLREATKSQNGANRKLQSNNTSGFKGVTWFKPAKRWMAQSKLNRKKVHLGYHDTAEQAHEAYCKFAQEAFGQFARTA